MGRVAQEQETFKNYKQKLFTPGGKRFFLRYYIAAKIEKQQQQQKPNSILSPNFDPPTAPFHCTAEIQTVGSQEQNFGN